MTCYFRHEDFAILQRDIMQSTIGFQIHVSHMLPAKDSLTIRYRISSLMVRVLKESPPNTSEFSLLLPEMVMPYRNHSKNIRTYLPQIFQQLSFNSICFGTRTYRKVMLENVQKFGLRICARQWDLGYNELLSNFHAPTL